MLEMIKKTPLFPIHQEEGAKIVPFAGWEMPLEYAGILKEHQAVREQAGLFDLSHMGEIEVSGKDGLAFVNSLITNDLLRLSQGQACYTVICREDGGILDDLLAYRFPDRVFLVVNASNTEKILRWLLDHSPSVRGGEVVIRDLTAETALVALQGPLAEEILQPLTPLELSSLPYYHARETEVAGIPSLLSRTGYTGEDGFEIYLKSHAAEKVWKRIRKDGVLPAGLGARDTLRLESGYALYGHELDESATPWEAGLGWVVALPKENFAGRDSLLEKKEKTVRKLAGFVMEDRSIPRAGYPILHEGKNVGQVTSGTFSPTLKVGIGMGYLPPPLASPDRRVEVEIRGRVSPARVIRLPFYKGSIRSKSGRTRPNGI